MYVVCCPLQRCTLFVAAVNDMGLNKVLAAVNNGHALLHYAAQLGYLPIIRLLCEWGVDVNMKTHITKATPLLTVVSHNLDADLTNDTVEVLIQCGARRSLNDENFENGDSPLFMAIRRRHDKVFKQLLSEGADPTKCDTVGNTILHIAAEVNATEVCNKIMAWENGVMKWMVEAKNEDRQTPIHLAAKHNKDCMDAIVSSIEEDCSTQVEWFSAPDNNGCTPLDIAAKACQEDTFDLMWRKMEEYSPAHIAVECNKLKTLMKKAEDDPSQWQKLSDALCLFPKRM